MSDDDPIETPSGAHTAPDDPGDGQLTLTDATGDTILSSAATISGSLPLGDGNEPAAPKGPGRPKGSKNKTTAQLHKYLLAKGYRHPAEMLADMMSQDTGELAKELSYKSTNKDGTVQTHIVPLKEAKLMQVAAAKELLPYFASKLPVQVEIKKEVRSLLLIGELGAADQDDVDEFDIQAILEEDQ